MTTNRTRATGAVGAIAIAAAIIAPSVMQHEGFVPKPAPDPIGIVTWCFGETDGKPKTSYTMAECKAMLDTRLQRDFGAGVVKCVPGLAAEDRTYQLAASMSLAYNIGVPQFCRSTAAKRFREGKWREGCDAFRMYRFAGGREFRGLVKRREDERKLCLQGVADAR